MPVLAGIILAQVRRYGPVHEQERGRGLRPRTAHQKMAKAKDRVKTSIEIAAELIKELKGMCQGVHIMPIGWENKVPALLDAAKL